MEFLKYVGESLSGVSFVAIIMTFFSILGAIDRILGNKFGLGNQFEKGCMLLGVMLLSMTGMIIISPVISDLLSPVFDFVYNVFKIDPSVIPASLFANDMGGAPLSQDVCKNQDIGMFNALVVSSMMGCTISFTIPFALSMVDKAHHKEVLLGLLCGIVTIPVGCFVGGLVAGLPILALLYDLLPLVIFSVIIALGLFLCPKISIKVFGIFGTFIKILITIGLCLGIVKFLTGIEIIKGLETFENGAMVCVNATAVMTGAFPFMFIISKLVEKPVKKLALRLGMNGVGAMGLIGSLATSATTFESMKKMDDKGIVMNSAFAVSAAFTFAGHLAFTLSFDSDYILPMIVGKLAAGITSLFVAAFMFKRNPYKGESTNVH